LDNSEEIINRDKEIEKVRVILNKKLEENKYLND